MHLRLAELVQVAHELEDVHARAPRKSERWPVVTQVLPERVPVAPLLRLVAAGRTGAVVVLRVHLNATGGHRRSVSYHPLGAHHPETLTQERRRPPRAMVDTAAEGHIAAHQGLYPAGKVVLSNGARLRVPVVQRTDVEGVILPDVERRLPRPGNEIPRMDAPGGTRGVEKVTELGVAEIRCHRPVVAEISLSFATSSNLGIDNSFW